jgi:hypothetical protein
MFTAAVMNNGPMSNSGGRVCVMNGKNGATISCICVTHGEDQAQPHPHYRLAAHRQLHLDNECPAARRVRRQQASQPGGSLNGPAVLTSSPAFQRSSLTYVEREAPNQVSTGLARPKGRRWPALASSSAPYGGAHARRRGSRRRRRHRHPEEIRLDQEYYHIRSLVC